MNTTNTRVITLCASIAFVLVVVTSVVGNAVCTQSNERLEKQSNVMLVECIRADKTPSDCRVLIYGSN